MARKLIELDAGDGGTILVAPEGASIDGTITDTNLHLEFGNLPMLRLRVEANSQQVQGGYSGLTSSNKSSYSRIATILLNL